MYACVHCRARFTQACYLQRHTQRCAQGKTVIDCPAERVEAPQTAFEKAFYPKHCASQESLRWPEREAERRKILIHHAARGQGGERFIERAPVDGCDPKTRTVFQYHSCHLHGCRKCYPNDRDKIIANNDQWLVRKFMEELERRGKNIQTKVRAACVPDDVKMLPKVQRIKIEECCDQVPVLGFNPGRYDLNLIREHFAERLSDTTGKVRVAKNGNKIMFLLTQEFRFLDIINYLGPRTSYEKWTKAYECTAEKSWFPYEWFDTPEKLDHPGLPDYPAGYSRLKGGYVLTRDEWEGCQRLFKEKGMRTFADWLRYYNNLDVVPAWKPWKECEPSTLRRGSTS